MELTRHMWQGHDYVAGTWEDWLADPHGLLAVAEFGGQVVGLCKLSRLAVGEWWLEGLRVHPEFQGGGIASRLHDYLIDYWQRTGGSVIRLATASSNTRVHHLARRTGFARIAELTPHRAIAIDEPTHSFRRMQPEEVVAAYEKARQSPALNLAYGLIDLGWQWVCPSPDHLAEAASEGRAWWWRGEDGLLLYWEYDEEGHDSLVVQLLACSLKHLPVMLSDFRRLAAALDYTGAAWLAPLRAELRPILEQAGFQRDWDEEIWVFEKHAP